MIHPSFLFKMGWPITERDRLSGTAWPLVWMVSVSCLWGSAASGGVGRQSKAVSELGRGSEILCRQRSQVEKGLVWDFALAMWRFFNVAARFGGGGGDC